MLYQRKTSQIILVPSFQISTFDFLKLNYAIFVERKYLILKPEREQNGNLPAVLQMSLTERFCSQFTKINTVFSVQEADRKSVCKPPGFLSKSSIKSLISLCEDAVNSFKLPCWGRYLKMRRTALGCLLHSTKQNEMQDIFIGCDLSACLCSFKFLIVHN